MFTKRHDTHGGHISDSIVVETKLREEFAKICFEILLEFSLMDTGEKMTDVVKGDSAVAGRLAVMSLLHRFESVLKKFADDEKNSGKCPPSRLVEFRRAPLSFGYSNNNVYSAFFVRYQISEVSFVLKAIATLVQSLRKAPPEKGNNLLLR